MLTAAMGVLFFAGLTFAAGSNARKSANQKTYVGVITDTRCGLGPHHGPAAQCVKMCVSMGAKYALASNKKVYVLEPQSMAAKHPGGSHVRVMGTLEGDTIHATSIEAVKAKSM